MSDIEIELLIFQYVYPERKYKIINRQVRPTVGHPDNYDRLNFLNSLDAMFFAEEVMSKKKNRDGGSKYSWYLYNLENICRDKGEGWTRYPIHAPARLRAEAFALSVIDELTKR